MVANAANSQKMPLRYNPTFMASTAPTISPVRTKSNQLSRIQSRYGDNVSAYPETVEQRFCNSTNRIISPLSFFVLRLIQFKYCHSLHHVSRVGDVSCLSTVGEGETAAYCE